MALLLSQLNKDKAAGKSASPGEDRWTQIFLMAARSALREIDNRTPLSPTIIDQLDQDTGLDVEYEFRLGEIIDYYIDAQNEWTTDDKRDMFQLKERAISKIKREYWRGSPPNGIKGGTRS